MIKRNENCFHLIIHQATDVEIEYGLEKAFKNMATDSSLIYVGSHFQKDVKETALCKMVPLLSPIF